MMPQNWSGLEQEPSTSPLMGHRVSMGQEMGVGVADLPGTDSGLHRWAHSRKAGLRESQGGQK